MSLLLPGLETVSKFATEVSPMRKKAARPSKWTPPNVGY